MKKVATKSRRFPLKDLTWIQDGSEIKKDREKGITGFSSNCGWGVCLMYNPFRTGVALSNLAHLPPE